MATQYPVKITAVDQDSAFDPVQGRKLIYKVSFTVGPHGPYVIEVDPKETPTTDIPKVVAQQAKAIQEIFDLTH